MSVGNLASALAYAMRRKRDEEGAVADRWDRTLAQRADRQVAGEERQYQRDQDTANQKRQAEFSRLQRQALELQLLEGGHRLNRTGPYAPEPVKRPWESQGFQTPEEEAHYRRTIAAATRAPERGPAESWERVTGADGTVVQINSRTRQMRPVMGPDGQPFRAPAAGGGQPTEGERKAYALYQIGEQGYQTIEALVAGREDDPSTPDDETRPAMQNPGWWTRLKSGVGGGVGNLLSSDQVRQLDQASNMMADAYLRFTSGAAVPPEEVNKFAKTFTPQPGDDPGTLANKADSRRVIMEALRTGAGRAGSQIGNDRTQSGNQTFPENPYR